MLKEKIVEYEGPDGPISVTVVRATVLIGAERSVARVEARDLIAENPDMSHALRILRGVTYPDLIVCTSQAEGITWPLSFEDFLLLDERFVDLWWEAVKEVNGHWYDRPSVEETRKKATTSTEE